MGVKSLWTLLTPVGRPVLLETMEGKSMAIDSSIWLYQFQATMRDKDGRVLVNAHILGFLRRIAKLLFYGIKPVFVFDGGAPALKRNTLSERKHKKEGAATSHAKLAEKILAAHLRREALKQAAPSKSKGKGKLPDPLPLDENTVYLEDIDGSVPKTPAKKAAPPAPSSSGKKNKFYDHDPYKLPQVDLKKAVAEATSSAAPDPRLATEDELRTFIEEMRPEDFDVNSDSFRELPTEVQYEIIGDLRLRSRQTSYHRLQNMLKSAKTPMDFSKEQIKNLKQRNALTQQLLATTDTIGSAHIVIPVRIAAERNRQYVLIKNEGPDGGWVLGIKDLGTREKPIEIEDDEAEVESEVEESHELAEESDEDMEEVEISQPFDSDLREFQRENALAAISSRQTSKGLRPLTKKSAPPIPHPIDRKHKHDLVFESEDEPATIQPPFDVDSEEDDQMLAFAIQKSLDHPRSEPDVPSFVPQEDKGHHILSDDDEDFVTRGRLETQLAIANTPIKGGAPSLLAPRFGVSSLGSPSKPPVASSSRLPASPVTPPKPIQGLRSTMSSPTTIQPSELQSESDGDMEEVAAIDRPIPFSFQQATTPDSQMDDSEGSPSGVLPIFQPQPVAPGSFFGASTLATLVQSSNEDVRTPEPKEESRPLPSVLHSTDDEPQEEALHILDNDSDEEMEEINVPLPVPQDTTPTPSPTAVVQGDVQSDHDEAPLFDLSRSPSPLRLPGDEAPRAPTPPPEEHWDATQEIDIQAEEGEFAKFVSQVKGRNLDEVRQEIDDEIRVLHQQRKAAMRDSDDITHQMATQIMAMLRLFGIPYITAPMEAEAQCAELVTLGLVDGVITDDSDVFLFGAERVYKNMFNQSKTVECFLLTDLRRELGLDRDTLVQLAYLLGSDYTPGLPGVGPVVAMELMKEFPGRDGLHKFKDWWTKVQSGKDKPEESSSKFRKQFKRRFKDLFLGSDWPNSIVRDAYYHPTVDSSDEPFKWALPDLDGLREFLLDELSWKQTKVDELILPIIQKMNQRGKAAALNMQGNLNGFFDITAGTGTFAPRQRQAYASKRLQQVITDFRKRQKSTSVPPDSAEGSHDADNSGGEREPSEPASDKPPPRKRARVPKAGTSNSKKATPAGSSRRGRGGKRGSATSKGKRRAEPEAEEEGGETSADDVFVPPEDEALTAVKATEFNLRPRPKPRPRKKPLSDAEMSDAGIGGS